jgi:hypothetical protein
VTSAKSAETSVALADAPPATPIVAEPATIPETAQAAVAEPAPPATPEPAPTVERAQVGEHMDEAKSLVKLEVAAPAPLAAPIELRPAAANAKTASPVRLEMEMSSAAQPEIPRAGIAPPIVLLDLAPRLSYLSEVDPVPAPWQSRAGRLEIRDFARATPTLKLGAALAEPRMERAMLPAKIAVAPAPSRNGMTLWTEPPQDFRDGQVQFGEIAALDLPTTGFETSGVYGALAAPVETSAEIAATPDREAATPAKTAEPETFSESGPFAASVAPVEIPEPESAPITENVATPLATAAAEAGASVAPPVDAPEVISTTEPVAGAPIEVPAIAASAESIESIDTRVAPVSPEPLLATETQTSLEKESSVETQISREAETSQEIEPSPETCFDRQALAGREPARVTQPMPVVLAGIPAGKAKALQIFTSPLKADVAGQIPGYETLPLRATMVLRRADASTPKAEHAKLESNKPEPTETESIKVEPAKPGKGRDAAKEPAAKVPVKWPAPRAHADPVGARAVEVSSPPEAKPVARGVPPASAEPAAYAPAAKMADSSRVIPQPVSRHAEAILKPRDPGHGQPGSERELAEVNREQAKLNREQAELNRAQAELNREQARRNRELAKTAEKVAASTVTSTVSSAALMGPSAAVGQRGTKPASFTSLSLNGAPQATEETDLGLPVLDLEALKGRFPPWARITAAAACVLLLLGGIWLFASHHRAKAPEVLGVSSLAGGAGPEWLENFSPDAKHPRTISILRASEKWTDYSVEFSASVDVGALGWVFRAKDPANFYVARIEQEKTLAGMAAAFVYFPVVDGVPQPRKRSSVALPAAPGTIYKIRFDAFGDQFTAWIQDRKVEEWTDSSLRSGGAGLYSESGERALLQGAFRVIPRTAAR